MLAVLIEWVIIAAVIVIIGILSYHIFSLLTKPKKESTINFYHRDSLNLDKFLDSARHRVDIFGITLEETTRKFRPTLQKILAKEDIKEVNILLTNPDITINKLIERQVDENIGTLHSSLQTIREMRKALRPDDLAKLHVRLSDEIPVQSIFITDRDEKRSVIRFEPYIYGIPKGNRRIFEILRKKQRKLYDIYIESFDDLWEVGTIYPL